MASLKNKTSIRVQKSRDCSHVQLVLVHYDADGKKQQKYFSVGYWILRNYILGENNVKFIHAEPMFKPGTPEYEDYLKRKKAEAKEKRRNEGAAKKL